MGCANPIVAEEALVSGWWPSGLGEEAAARRSRQRGVVGDRRHAGPSITSARPLQLVAPRQSLHVDLLHRAIAMRRRA
jgi:hypothetical protein